MFLLYKFYRDYGKILYQFERERSFDEEMPFIGAAALEVGSGYIKIRIG